MTAVNLDFMDLRTRAELLELCDDAAGAAGLRARSLEIAREVDLTCYGYQLIWRNRIRDAVEILEHSVSQHPQSANAWESLGDAFVHAGNLRRAMECFHEASRLVKDEAQRLRIEQHVRELIALGAIAS